MSMYQPGVAQSVSARPMSPKPMGGYTYDQVNRIGNAIKRPRSPNYDRALSTPSGTSAATTSGNINPSPAGQTALTDRMASQRDNYQDWLRTRYSPKPRPAATLPNSSGGAQPMQAYKAASASPIGRAQSIPPQSLGSVYGGGNPPPRLLAAEAQGTSIGEFAPAGTQRPIAGPRMLHDSNGDGVDDRLAKAGLGKSPQRPDPWMGGTPYGQQPSGNLAYAPPDQRPPPFQAAYGQIGGGYAPQQNAGQRDAFISNINNQLGQMQQQSWASPGSVGAPQFNFGQMWGQAGDMVQQGWQSPLAGLFGGASPAASARLLPGAAPPPPPQGFYY